MAAGDSEVMTVPRIFRRRSDAAILDIATMVAATWLHLEPPVEDAISRPR
ncbi:protein of unknown function [Agreia sp. COWG]|nr:protein of unknown function [Agreia sp. COWG]CAD6010869.1 protein of unknown function [Agreia sp. COWG]